MMKRNKDWQDRFDELVPKRVNVLFAGRSFTDMKSVCSRQAIVNFIQQELDRQTEPFERIYNNESDLRETIKLCQKNKHIQQVAYSTYHDGITQVCFACRQVRTTVVKAINHDDKKDS